MQMCAHVPADALFFWLGPAFCTMTVQLNLILSNAEGSGNQQQAFSAFLRH